MINKPILVQSCNSQLIKKVTNHLNEFDSCTVVDISNIFEIYQSSHIEINRIYENLPGSILESTNSDIEDLLVSKYQSSSIRHVYHLFHFICTLYLNFDNPSKLKINQSLKNFILQSNSKNVSILQLILQLAYNEKVTQSESAAVFFLESDQLWYLNSEIQDITSIALSDTSTLKMHNQNQYVVGSDLIDDKGRLDRLFTEVLPSTRNQRFEKYSKNTDVASNDHNLIKPDFFIVGIPRTGTSLLSSLLNTHPKIVCAQDSGIFNEFSDTMRTIIQRQKVSRKELNTEQASNILLVLDSSFGEMINTTKIDPNDVESKFLLSLYLTNLFRFYLHDYTIPDPRKDRDTGEKYFTMIDLDIIFDQVLNNGITFNDLFNLLVSFISSSTKSKNLIGEKTPIGAVRNDYINTIYPNAKFINIIRHPIGYYGSRSQRLDVSVEDHCNFYKIGFDNMKLEGSNVITIRYEDLINEPNNTMLSIFNFLNIESIDVEKELKPGVYNKYVGKKIDKDRDNKNIELVPEEIKSIIKSRLKDVITRFYE